MKTVKWSAMTAERPLDLSGWLARIEACHPAEIELGLNRLQQVAQRLPIDLESVCKIVIAGTNGKGSTLAMLDAILSRAGYTTGSYTSPHFLRYNERVCVSGKPVDDAALCEAFTLIEQARGETPLTYFEYGTLAALLIFSQRQVDVALLEVGLGGRLDAVNIVDADIALVTTVALDHTDWLGPDRESIGREKAGIFRAGKPALCGDPKPPATLVDYARTLGAPLQLQGVDFSYELKADQWSWQSEGRHLDALPVPALPLPNAALVLAALQHFPHPVSEQAIREGLVHACLKGRLQPVQLGQVRATVDVAHNPEAAGYLAHWLSQRPCSGQIHLILGMLADKDIESVVQALTPVVDVWHPVSLDVPRGAPRERLEAALLGAGVSRDRIRGADSVAVAVNQLQSMPAADQLLLAGSFFTVAQALELAEQE
jgi:dihydrofolate synthase/folylpolyglutamate synthase